MKDERTWSFYTNHKNLEFVGSNSIERNHLGCLDLN